MYLKTVLRIFILKIKFTIYNLIVCTLYIFNNIMYNLIKLITFLKQKLNQLN